MRWPILFVGATLALSITFSKGTAFAQGTSDCEPSCRSGYVCSSGQCVSACNPPCASNEKCTADARCISRSTTTAAPPTSQPIPESHTGEAMGGDGSLASTYLLGLAGFAPFPAASDDSAIVILAIGMVLEPFLAPLGYELSSHIKAKSQLGTLGAIRFRSTPLSGARGELRGGTFSVGAEF